MKIFVLKCTECFVTIVAFISYMFTHVYIVVSPVVESFLTYFTVVLSTLIRGFPSFLIGTVVNLVAK